MKVFNIKLKGKLPRGRVGIELAEEDKWKCLQEHDGDHGQLQPQTVQKQHT